jgi:hypothetical protein
MIASRGFLSGFVVKMRVLSFSFLFDEKGGKWQKMMDFFDLMGVFCGRFFKGR